MRHAQRVSGRWAQRFAFRDGTGKWGLEKADVVYRWCGDSFKLPGGVSLTKLDVTKKGVFTCILLQSCSFGLGTTYSVEVGDDLLSLVPPPPRRIATSGMITPFNIYRLAKALTKTRTRTRTSG